MADARMDLASRLAALDDVIGAAEGRLDDSLVESARDLQSKAAERLARGAHAVVVALAGGTGSGKSSLFNALSGQQLALTGPVRPVTGEAMALAVGDPDASSAVLDWLRVRRRHHVAGSDELPEGLVLLDLPDHDSVVAEHRLAVDRYVERVDVLIWVVDPLKYAQRTLHTDYLRRLAEHAEVLLVVLNRIDDLAASDRDVVLRDLRDRLDEDGLREAEIHATSARTGEGIAALRTRIGRFVADRRAVAARISADLAAVASTLEAHVGTPRAGELSPQRLTGTLVKAAGVDDLTSAAAAAYSDDANDASRPLVTGAALRRLRRAKLAVRRARLRPRRGAWGHERQPSPVAVRHALLELSEQAARGLPHPWPGRLSAAAGQMSDNLPAAVGKALDGVVIDDVGRRRWWLPMRLLGTLLELCGIVGLVWLTVLAVLDYLRLTVFEPPAVGNVPWPTLLLGVGVVGLLLFSLLRRRVVNVGASRHARRVRRMLHAAVAGVAAQHVITPLREELAAHDRLALGIASLRR